MRFLLLLSLPLSLVNSCLVIQYPVTSTPKPFCGCPFKILNAYNLKETVGNNSYYPTVLSQRLLEPSGSGDNCSRSLTCPSDYDLVVFNMDQHKLFNDVELSAMCDPFSQQWLVDDGIHEIETFSQLYVTCVTQYITPPPPGCYCPALPVLFESNYTLPGSITPFTVFTAVPGYPNSCYGQNFTCSPGDYVYIGNGTTYFSTEVSSLMLRCIGSGYQDISGNYWYYEEQKLGDLKGVFCLHENGGNFISKFLSYFHY